MCVELLAAIYYSFDNSRLTLGRFKVSKGPSVHKLE